MVADERLAAAFGRFAGLVRSRAIAGLAHPDPRGMERALRDIYAAVDDLLQQLAAVESPFGYCDTCGADCDAEGCTAERAHLAAIDGTDPRCHLCTYRAIDSADLIEHHRLNHGGTP